MSTEDKVWLLLSIFLYFFKVLSWMEGSIFKIFTDTKK